MSKLRVIIFLILLTTTIYYLGSSPLGGYAHAELERSEPAANAVVSESPPEVHIWFTQELFRREGANSLEVFASDGTQVDNGDSRIDDDDRAHLLVSLQNGLPDGPYIVKWRNLSIDDGHEGSGEFSFNVASDASPAEASPATPPLAETPSPAPTLPAPNPPSGSNLPCLGGLIMSMLLLGLVWQFQGHN